MVDGAFGHSFEQGTTPAKFDLIWFSGFRGEDINVKVYVGQDTKWCQNLIWPWARWAKNIKKHSPNEEFFNYIIARTSYNDEMMKFTLY